jgi:hypothetical protein
MANNDSDEEDYMSDAFLAKWLVVIDSFDQKGT